MYIATPLQGVQRLHMHAAHTPIVELFSHFLMPVLAYIYRLILKTSTCCGFVVRSGLVVNLL